MSNTPIFTLSYKKNPTFYTLLNFNVIFFLAIYFAGAINMPTKDNLVLFTFFMLPLPILVGIMSYNSVLDAVIAYQKLQIFKDKIVVNSKEYSIDEISCEVEEHDHYYKIIVIAWTKCILKDKEGRIIGEFVFRIGYVKGFFDATANSIKELIDDLRMKKVYDYNEKVRQDFQQFKLYDDNSAIGLYILIVVLMIPAVVIALLKN